MQRMTRGSGTSRPSRRLPKVRSSASPTWSPPLRRRESPSRPTPSSRGGTSKIELVVDYISTTENCNSHSLPCLSSSSCPSPADPTFDAVDASDPAQPIGLAILHAQKGIHIYKTRSVKGIKKKAFFSLPR